jgi:hypothetical protein
LKKLKDYQQDIVEFSRGLPESEIPLLCLVLKPLQMQLLIIVVKNPHIEDGASRRDYCHCMNITDDEYAKLCMKKA